MAADEPTSSPAEVASTTEVASARARTTEAMVKVVMLAWGGGHGVFLNRAAPR